jgi:formylglycine-generating enzyme required for sulfatase activity
MEAGTMLLAAALGKALYEVGKEVVAKPLLEPIAEQVKARVRRGYDAKVDDAKVRQALAAAIETVGLDKWEEAEYPLRGAADRLKGKEQEHEALRKQTVAAVLQMTGDAPEQVPDELLQALRVPASHRADLARFLWAFQEALVDVDEDYRALVESAGDKEIRELLWAIATGEAILTVRLAPPDERKIEARYLSLVMSECSKLPLGGRDIRDSAPTGFSMPLDKVYIALNTTERPPQAREEKQALTEMPDADRMGNISALRVLLDHHCLVLLGEPGSGKTTFADHLALCLAGERSRPGTGWAERLKTHDAAWDGPAPLPIRVRLRHFAADRECLPSDSNERGRAEDLLDYVEKRLREGKYGADLPDHALGCMDRTGNGLLILDGLDEVGGQVRRGQVAQAIVDLSERRCPCARLLVTCRVRQYPLDGAGRPTAAWALPGFYVATLADFDGAQIDAFIKAWFYESYAPRSDRLAEMMPDQKISSLKEAIGLRPDLQQIAPRPILLTQMALVHDFEGELPGTRVQLYDKCADLLLWKWEQLRAMQAGQQLTAESFIREQMGVPGLKKENLQGALDHAVYDAHAGQGADDEGPTDIPEETLRQRLGECLKRADRSMPNHEVVGKAQFFIDEYLCQRNGLIVPAGERTFQTPHRTFQEFLAARRLQLHRNFDREAPRLVGENYDLWRVVFLLAVGQTQLGAAVDAVYNLCPKKWPTDDEGWQRLILAGQGLDEIGLPTVRGDEYRGEELENLVVRLLLRTMQDTDQRGRPYKRPRVPVSTRYQAAETLDRLGWMPPDLNTWVPINLPPLGEERGGASGFWIARYPVTNHQFALFKDAGGYEEPRYWDGERSEAWKWRITEHNADWRGKDRVTQPEYWDDPRFGKSRRGYPVVGVSWYEALAYCAWLSELLERRQAGEELAPAHLALVAGLPEDAARVRLPTGEEWETAAGGGEGDRYPWGTEFHESRANTGEDSIRGTTPVGMYPSGRSPAGVWDMGGNVWEWMASEEEIKPLRGGSWGDLRGLARVREQSGFNPGGSDFFVGLRVVSSPVSSGS